MHKADLSGLRVQEFHLQLEFIWEPFIIVIEKRNVFALRVLHAGISRPAFALILGVFDIPHTRIVKGLMVFPVSSDEPSSTISSSKS